MTEFDYIIVGAGSAGCILANKLSENGKYTIALLEAGGKDASPWVKMPVGYGKAFYNDKLNWRYTAQPEKGLNGRADYWPRGKTLGGSSSINALVYCRGLPNDFNDWEEAGAKGWGWKNVKPHFEAIETNVGPDGNKTGNGPIHVSDVSDQVHKVCRHFFNASEELSIPRTKNHNSDEYEGASEYRITTKNGFRSSSSTAFLHPVKNRSNLKIILHAEVDHIKFENKRAAGVVYRQHGRPQIINARREVILSAGTVASPVILQRSGLGPARILKQHNIPVLVDNENIGGNLQDHLGINYYFKATEPTLNNVLSPWWGKLLAGMQYVFTRKGPLSLSVNQCGGFFKSDTSLAYPDQQLYFNPVTYTTQVAGKRTAINPDPFAGFIIGMQPSRPTSRGRIDIASTNPSDMPLIQPNYLSTNKDMQDVIAGAKLCQRIMNTDAMAELIKEPMNDDFRKMDDASLLKDFRNRSGTVFHPVSTCKMGSDISTSVTDSNLKVFGVDGLRVVDASVFPNVTSGNTNAPVLMLAHRAADLILKAD
ncbi:GMC family oxidoreductase [Curvivirga aplysinae]|uniref:GMC family oxidoreductase n=1 Tax=Curvivirga aplysinae TaxID=2529852 RepID=UPI0012BB9F22|nr:GMC family oxidoreductase N-terminal domain-containing protein [Curvivirga aplysinae]MTI11003.1 choline dehydrogenase [Curvivirga aplysinae]